MVTTDNICALSKLPLRIPHPQIPKLSTCNIKQDPMDQQSALLHRIVHNHITQQRLNARGNIQLRQSGSPRALIYNPLELALVLTPQLLQRRQPRIQHAADAAIRQRRPGTPATRVPAQHNVLDLEVLDGVLDHSAGVDVGRADDVGDVAVDKDIARLEAEDRRLRDARVGAAEPEDRRGLAASEGWEERGVLMGFVGCPGGVGGERVGEAVGCVGG